MNKMIKLGDVCKIYQSKTISKKEMVENGVYPVYGANGIIGRYNEYNHEEEQLLIGCRGNCGAVNVSEPYAWINGNAMVIQPDKSKFSLRYMEYLFRYGVDLSKAITGVAQPQITRQSLSPIQIICPPLAEQKRIAEKLNQAEVLRQKRQQTLILLDELKTSIFISMFGDTVTNEKNFRMIELGDVCEILDSLRRPITKKDRVSGDFPYYGATGIVDYVAEYIFDDELVLVGEDGAKWGVGEKSAFIAKGKFWVNNHAHVLKPHPEMMMNEWITYYLNGINLEKWVTGITVPKLNQKKLKSIPMPLPPIEEQKRFVEKINQIESLQKKYDDSFALLDELFTSLHYQAFSGELPEAA